MSDYIGTLTLSMGSKSSKVNQVSQPGQSTCVRYMYENYGPESISDGDKWCLWTDGDRKEFPRDGTFERGRIDNLRRELEERGKRKKTADEVNWRAFSMWSSECRDREKKTNW